MRLGLYGGTFDPVHLGHLIVAEQCREQCRLDEVWFLPTAAPPHKRDARITPGPARVEMLELAVAGHAAFSVNRLELERGGTTYTVDTLEQLHDEAPDRELFFLMGADSLDDLATWRAPERIARLATIVAVNRGERPLPSPEGLAGTLGEAVAGRVRFVTMPAVDLSATDIRGRVAAGRSIRFLVPRAVEMYIAEHGLYV